MAADRPGHKVVSRMVVGNGANGTHDTEAASLVLHATRDALGGGSAVKVCGVTRRGPRLGRRLSCDTSTTKALCTHEVHACSPCRRDGSKSAVRCLLSCVVLLHSSTLLSAPASCRYPVYPPMRLQVWVGASPYSLQPASPWHDVQASDALQTFALWPHAPIGR
jgi:hypothetical protein